MGYTALLFCPDEKTARTVTQVLSELEFTVEACIEPFAAVKKLMGQHFDAVVVDCDNEQNATLLFKSARNSASNQTSLAVAVVEGQAGVAKAFRIGANLVLTKPINIEQSKGTLRVARGLLRKSEPAKPAAPSAAPSSATAIKPTATTPAFEPKTEAPVEPAPVFTAQAAEVPVVKPTPMWSAAAVASSKPAGQDDDLLDIDEDEPAAKPAPPPTVAPVTIPAVSHAEAAASAATASFSASKSVMGGGAASAPAPARENKSAEKPTASDGDDDVLETSAQPAQSSPAVVGSAPSFTFGGADAQAESSGAGKKIGIGIAAAAIVAAGLYFGWARLHGSTDQPVRPQAPVSTAAAAAPAPKPSAVQPAPLQPVPATVPSAENLATSPSKEASTADADEEKNAATEATKSSVPSSKPAAEDKSEPAPLMVTGGKAPAQKKAVAADADAPSAIGLAAGDAVPPPTFVPGSDAAFKPTLQTVNISQGVSQGLLIKKVPPSYPASAIRMRIEGKVELMATISKTGEITNIQVLSGDSQLTKAATAAVKQWKYKPYLLNGEPVEIQTQVTVNFKLPQ